MIRQQQQQQLVRSVSLVRTLATSAGKHAPHQATPEPPKGPWQRFKEFLMFRPDAPAWVNYPRKAAVGQGFRYPSPASRPQPNIPTVEKEDDLFNTQYYTRDTKRNQGLAKLISPEPPKEFPVDAPVEMGSKGRKNPAVERYDPTGTRSAMTTTWKAMNDELAKHQPDHLPKPWWEAQPQVLQEANERAKKNGVPSSVGVARGSLGIPRYHAQW